MPAVFSIPDVADNPEGGHLHRLGSESGLSIDLSWNMQAGAPPQSQRS